MAAPTCEFHQDLSGPQVPCRCLYHRPHRQTTDQVGHPAPNRTSLFLDSQTIGSQERFRTHNCSFHYFFKDLSVITQVVVEAGWCGEPQHPHCTTPGISMSYRRDPDVLHMTLSVTDDGFCVDPHARNESCTHPILLFIDFFPTSKFCPSLQRHLKTQLLSGLRCPSRPHAPRRTSRIVSQRSLS